MGSKRKVIAVYKALERKDFPRCSSSACTRRWVWKSALDPEEIAVSITAELIAVRRDAAGCRTNPSRFPKPRNCWVTDPPD